MKHRPRNVVLKPEFEERMKKLLTEGDDDFKNFSECIKHEPVNAIRCNTLKISSEKLRFILESKGWVIDQPFINDYPELMIIKNDLLPGELGRCREHLLGYYYVQEISSQLPLLALRPSEKDFYLDCCASPGSKTTQASCMMNNSGTIIANDKDIGRVKILASNAERCSASNIIITRDDAIHLCQKITKRSEIKFDKILVDAPCSGEGTLRSSLMASRAWNFKVIKSFSRKQKFIASSALETLKVGGEMIYSTCTHAPEEDEVVVQHLLNNYDIELINVKSRLPENLKTREGITDWNGEKFSDCMNNCVRIYPHDNDTEGFFICLMKKKSEEKKDNEVINNG